MKKRPATRFLSACLALIMVFGILPTFHIGANATIPITEGLTVKVVDRYTTDETPTKEPLTFEAEFTLGANTGWLGTIIGNWDYIGRTGASLDLGWDSNYGVYPRLLYNKTTLRFSEIDMRDYASNGQYARLIVTVEKNAFAGETYPNKITCYVYVDGELVQSQYITGKGINLTPVRPYVVGFGYYKYGAADSYRAFAGHIKNISVYSDVRTPEELVTDGKKFTANSGDTNLLLAYNFTSRTPLKDLSSHHNDLTNLGEYKYTFHQGTITERYRMDKEFTSAPHTFAAEILTNRAGVIFSNYKDNTLEYMSFEVNSAGAPLLKFSTEGGTLANVVFSDVNAFSTTAPNKVVVTHSDTEIKCYLNGELKQTVTGDFKYHTDTMTEPDIISKAHNNNFNDPNDQYFILGGDCSESNANYFEGAMTSFSIYSEALGAEEIADLSTNGKNADIDSTIAYYDLNDYWEGYIADISGNQYHVSHLMYEMREDTRGDYAYSFAVVGDTQRQARMDYQVTTGSYAPTDQTYTDDQIYMKRAAYYYDWIVSNKEEKKIQYVFGMGDITNYDYDLEWYIMKKQITKLDGAGIPYSLIVGNHDTVDKLTSNFAPAGDDFYTKRVSGFFEEGVLGNYYMNFEVGTTKYMVMNFEYQPSDEALAWANEVVAAHPERRVIVTTHSYTNGNGAMTESDGGNGGEDMWEKFVSLHGNIILVLSGHCPSYQVVSRQDIGINGNTVTRMLIDPQAEHVNRAPVCMLYFNEDGSKVSVEFISAGETIIARNSNPENPDVLYRANSQFDLTLIPDEPASIHTVMPSENGYTAYYTNGTCADFTLDAPLADVNGYSLNLKGNVGVNAYLNVPAFASYDKLSVKFTVDGEETVIPFSAAKVNADHGYGFECLVNATQMTSRVSVELYYEDILITSDEYSVVEYAKRIMTDDTYADARDVVRAMLNYGSLAQEYFGIEADNPAAGYAYTTELDTVTRDAIAALSSNKSSGAVEGLTYKGSWVELRSTLVLYHQFEVSGNIDDYTFKHGDAKITPISMGGNLYAVAVTEIYAQNMAIEYALTVTDGSDSYTHIYNAMNYLKLAYGDATLKNLVSSLYLYYVEAYEYSN